MDMWYYGEIHLINCLLFYFSKDSLLSISERLLVSLERYEEFRPMKVLRISIMLNLSCLLIQNNKAKNSVGLIEQVLIWSREEHRYDYLGIAKVRLRICEKNKEMISQGLDLLEKINELDIKKALIEEVNLFI